MTASPESAWPPQRVAWSWRTLRTALAYLYLPQLLALFVGPLSECSDCTASFFALWPVMPGFLFASMLMVPGKSMAAAIAIAAVCNLAILAGLTAVLQERSRMRLAIAWFVAIVSASTAVALGMALRA
ncbi:MAG: hypothetical protein U1F36_11745 [Planctomycetota bacterium]